MSSIFREHCFILKSILSFFFYSNVLFIQYQNLKEDSRNIESQERLWLTTISIVSSWMAPISVLKNDHSCEYKWHLFITCFCTKTMLVSFVALVYFRYNDVLTEEFLAFLIAELITMAVFYPASFFLHLLGNYFNLYRASNVCRLFCVSPIVHKALIFEYLENSSYFLKGNEEDTYPKFFHIFMKEKKNLSLPGK